MKPEMPVPDKGLSPNPPEFSLVLGGPLYQLLRRSHLSDDAMTLLYRRIIFLSLFCWLPPLFLSAWEGNLSGGSVIVPFLLDIELHVRFLGALPLLIWAELVVHKRLVPLVTQFQKRQLIPDSAMEQYTAAITSSLRLRNSLSAEVLLILFVYSFGILYLWPQYIALDATTWYAKLTTGGLSFSLAGKWYAYISMPIFQFLLLRWYFRLFIWIRFLWSVSRIELKLLPMHPDGAGGMGFLGGSVITFAPVLMAHGAILAGLIASRIFFRGANLLDFKMEMLFLIIYLMCLMFTPLLVFSRQMEQARRKGISDYGALAARYIREFDAKWLSGAPETEPLVGSADIQSLADMGNSFGNVKSMDVVPFSKGAILQLAGLTVAPIVPLALTMMSLEELLKMLFGVLF